MNNQSHNILDSYLNQLGIMNKLQSGNFQQFIPSGRDTSFLRGGCLPRGGALPNSSGGLSSHLYDQKRPAIKREIESVSETKAVVKTEEQGEDQGEKDANMLPEDTNKSTITLSGTTGSSSSSSSSRVREDDENPIEDKKEEKEEKETGGRPKGEEKETGDDLGSISA